MGYKDKISRACPKMSSVKFKRAIQNHSLKKTLFLAK